MFARIMTTDGEARLLAAARYHVITDLVGSVRLGHAVNNILTGNDLLSRLSTYEQRLLRQLRSAIGMLEDLQEQQRTVDGEVQD